MFEQIILTVLGGMIAASAGLYVDKIRQRDILKKQRELFKISICDDLSYSIELYDKIFDEWEKTKTVWFTTLNELKGSRQVYLNMRDWIIIITKPETRKQIFRYYQKSTELINLIEYQQQRKGIIDARYTDYLRKVNDEFPEIGQQEADNRARQLLGDEANEFDQASNFLDHNINKLKEYRDKAKELLHEL